MKNFNKYIIIFLVIFALIFGGLYLVNRNDDSSDNNDKTEKKTEESKNKISEKELGLYATKDDQNAFDLLKDNAEVDYEDSDFGVFVKGINDLAGDDKNYWALYVNDEYSQTAADSTILKKDDKVVWIYEEIKF